MPILQQFHKCFIDRLVDDAVHEHVHAFFNRGARRFQFGRVHGDADFARVAFFNRRTHDRPKRIDRMILINDVPDLQQIRILLRELAYELARLIRIVDLNNWRIAQIELRPRHA